MTRLTPKRVAMPKNPEGLDVGSDGTIYYSELNLQTDVLAGEFFSTGCGSVSKYKPGDAAPKTLAGHLRFPDGITVVDSAKLDLSNLASPSDETGKIVKPATIAASLAFDTGSRMPDTPSRMAAAAIGSPPRA